VLLQLSQRFSTLLDDEDAGKIQPTGCEKEISVYLHHQW
jgi:hypothetical protein